MAYALALFVGLLSLVSGNEVQWIRQEVGVPIHSPEKSSWLKQDRAPATEVMSLLVALRVDPERQRKLEKVLFEVSDPRHARYGKFYSRDEVTALLAVPKERAAIARRHFEEAGAADVTVASNGDSLTVTATVSAVEVALNTKIHVFTHREDGVRILRAGEPYWLPMDVSSQVTMVGELLQFPRLGRKLHATGEEEEATWPNDCGFACRGKVTPGVIAQRYNLPDDPGSPSNNSMSVAEFQGQCFDKYDLKHFSAACHTNVTVDEVIGKCVGLPGIEAELDIEYIKAVAPSVDLTVIYQAEYSLMRWVSSINQMDSPPLVHSVSYGNDEGQQSSEEYMDMCNIGFMKAGARGLTILFASGDQGVCGREGCERENGRFHPDFPASSPYITSVGGTNFLTRGVIGDEEAWDGSGGGFSDHFERPDYQKEAVQAYLDNPEADLPPSSKWNSSGRAYPDIAALGGTKNTYCVFNLFTFKGVAGTSASCPVVAGIFARINGLLLSRGKPQLGFVNPLLYQHGDRLQDVTHGKNTGGEFNQDGFKAIEGWDPATGLGTPNFGTLARAVLERGTEAEIVV